MRTKYIYYIFTITNQSLWEGEGGAISGIDTVSLFVSIISISWRGSITTYSLTVVSIVDNAAED